MHLQSYSADVKIVFTQPDIGVNFELIFARHFIFAY